MMLSLPQGQDVRLPRRLLQGRRPGAARVQALNYNGAHALPNQIQPLGVAVREIAKRQGCGRRAVYTI